MSECCRHSPVFKIRHRSLNVREKYNSNLGLKKKLIFEYVARQAREDRQPAAEIMLCVHSSSRRGSRDPSRTQLTFWGLRTLVVRSLLRFAGRVPNFADFVKVGYGLTPLQAGWRRLATTTAARDGRGRRCGAPPAAGQRCIERPMMARRIWRLCSMLFDHLLLSSPRDRQGAA
jgi:hypothetical protein